MIHLYNIYKIYKFIFNKIYDYIYLDDAPNDRSIHYDSNDSHYIDQSTSLLIKF